MSDKVLVLRTCDANLRSHEGFQYPASGIVEAPDWQPTAECGNGLHGFLWGQGDGSLANFAEDSKWLVLSVDPTDMVNLGGQKVKFRRGEIVFVGDRKAATDIFVAKGYVNVIGSMVTVGDEGTAIVGFRGTATAGNHGTATAGNHGTATAGYKGTATAGVNGTLSIKWYDSASDRWRLATAYVGENGIEPNVAYCLDNKGNFVKAESHETV